MHFLKSSLFTIIGSNHTRLTLHKGNHWVSRHVLRGIVKLSSGEALYLTVKWVPNFLRVRFEKKLTL